MTADLTKPAASGEVVLVGDIGGTNARFALFAGGQIDRMETLRVEDYPRFEDAARAYLIHHQDGRTLTASVLAVAGPVEGNRCDLTNSPWTIDGDAIKAALGLRSSLVVNDFEALAWSLPRLVGDDLRQIGGGKPQPAAPMVVLGPGTGLGVGAYVPGKGGPIVVPTEGGHATLPATSDREAAIVRHLRDLYDHVSAERALSGQGLENLYHAVIALDGLSAPPRDAAGITGAALDGSCPAARAALDLFCSFLGCVAGNLALSYGARGGVFIGGGIAPRIVEYLAASSFRAQFEAKGRMSVLLEPIPVWVIVRPEPTFVGLQALAEQPN